jgi:hypothetical protein
MSKPQRGGEPLVLAGGRLGDLAFDWAGDRYHHAWHFAGPAGADPRAGVAVLSVESGSDVAWPVSPPLQQIHRQSFADGREVVFGVGMAGRGHWSASFTLIPDLSCWIVELACRASVAPEELLSSYRLQGTWTQDGESGVRCDQCPQSLRLEAIRPSSTAELGVDLLKFSPEQLASTSATQQWAFKLIVGTDARD